MIKFFVCVGLLGVGLMCAGAGSRFLTQDSREANVKEVVPSPNTWTLHVVPSKGWTGPGQVVPLDGTELVTPWSDDWIVVRLTVGENMHWWEVRVLDEIRWSGTGPDVGTFDIVVLKMPGNVNGDGETNLIDVAYLKSKNGVDPAAPGNARFDLNSDGSINLIDMALCKSLRG